MFDSRQGHGILRTWIVAAIAVGVFVLLYVAPIMGSGVTEFDAPLSQIHVYQRATGASAWQAMQHFATTIQLDRGAFLPLSAIQPLFWLIVPNVVVAKLIEAITISVDIAAFCFFICLLSRSASLGVLSALGTILSLEFRKPHDAVLGSTAALPLTVAFLTVSLVAYLLFVRTGRRSWLAPVFLFGIASSLSNETAIFLSLTFVALDGFGFGSRWIGSLIVALPASCVLAVSAIRRGFPESVRWIASGNARGLHDALAAFVSIFPNSYRAFGNVVKDGIPAYVGDTRFEAIPAIDLLGLVAVLFGTIVGYACSTNKLDRVGRRSTMVLGTIAALWVLAAVSTHDHGQWISGMPIGEAYSSSYVGCFGFGIAFALSILGIHRMARMRAIADLVPVGVAVFVFCELYGNTRVNAKVIAFDRNRYESLRLVIQAAHDHVFERLPNDSVIAFDGAPPLPIDTGIGSAELLGIVDPGGIRRARVADDSYLRSNPFDRRRWVVRREITGVRSGALTLAHVAAGSNGSSFDRAILYRSYPNVRARHLDAVRFDAPVRGVSTSVEDSGGANVVEVVQRSCGVASLDDFYDPEQPTVTFGDGFYHPDGYKRWDFWATNYMPSDFDDRQTWRYGGRRAVLEIHPDRCRHEQVRLSAWVFSVGAGYIVIDAPGERIHFPIWDTGRPLDLNLTSTSSRTVRVAFSTFAPSAKEVLGYPGFVDDTFGPARVVVSAAQVVDVPAAVKL